VVTNLIYFKGKKKKKKEREKDPLNINYISRAKCTNYVGFGSLYQLVDEEKDKK
jgi:hypothetical protein